MSINLAMKALILVLPSVAIVVAVYIFTNKWYQVQMRKSEAERNKKAKTNSKTSNVPVSVNEQFFPMQVDAYQRLVLLMERISPSNLVMRLNNPGLPARAFQQKLLENIRSEFEHNLAQQIFVSNEAWHLVKQSREEVVKVINMAGTNLSPEAMAGDLSQGVLEISAQLDKQPTDIAITYLKTEFQRYLK